MNICMRNIDSSQLHIFFVVVHNNILHEIERVNLPNFDTLLNSTIHFSPSKFDTQYKMYVCCN